MSGQSDEFVKIIPLQRQARKGTLEPVRRKYGACRHESTYVDEEKREVTCQKCDTRLDPFEVLLELAETQRRLLDDLDHWDAYRESLLGERYDVEWERAHEGVITEPPVDPVMRKIWDMFRSVMGEKFCRMYRRKRGKRSGPEWYGVSVDGGCYSYEYARSKTVRKAAV